MSNASIYLVGHCPISESDLRTFVSLEEEPYDESKAIGRARERLLAVRKSGKHAGPLYWVHTGPRGNLAVWDRMLRTSFDGAGAVTALSPCYSG